MPRRIGSNSVAGTVVAGLLVVPQLWASGSIAQINDNTILLEVSISTDRQWYFPGEEMVVTLRVRNPTAVPREVGDPFNPKTSRFQTWRVVPGQEEPPPYLERCQGVARDIATPRTLSPPITLAAGEERQAVFKSIDRRDRCAVLHYHDHAPDEEGNYRIRYAIGTVKIAETDITIVSPMLAAWTTVRLLPDAYIPAEGGMPEDTSERHRHVFAAFQEWPAATYICVDRTIAGSPNRWTLMGRGNLAPVDARTMSPYKRVATATPGTAVTAIEGTVDGQGNLTIIWTETASGGSTSQRTVHVDADLNPL